MVKTNTMDNRLVLIFYKLRFLIIYTFIGLISLIVENIIRSQLINSLSILQTNFISITSSVIFAYILNVKFNFKVPKERIRVSIIYFSLISIFSFILQYSVSSFINIEFFQNRFQLSGSLFFIAYLLHRKFTFKNYYKVGLAIHLNNQNVVSDIYQKVKNIPDFIHVDLIDETINKENISSDILKIHEILETWPNKKIQIHIMSLHPLNWIKQFPNGKNIEVFFHLGGNDNYEEINNFILNKKYSPGIVLDDKSNIESIKPLAKIFTNFMVLCIDKPGFSGQKFKIESQKIINELVSISKLNKSIKITLDGGITPKIASRYNVQEVVSASAILGSEDSKKQIINFQTSQKYEAMP